MMGDGIFGSMFDFNRDGTLDALERAVEFQFFDEILSEENEDSLSDFEDECDFYDQ